MEYTGIAVLNNNNEIEHLKIKYIAGKIDIKPTFRFGIGYGMSRSTYDKHHQEHIDNYNKHKISNKSKRICKKRAHSYVTKRRKLKIDTITIGKSTKNKIKKLLYTNTKCKIIDYSNSINIIALSAHNIQDFDRVFIYNKNNIISVMEYIKLIYLIENEKYDIFGDEYIKTNDTLGGFRIEIFYNHYNKTTNLLLN